jgi:hypothetical protein
MRIDAVKRVLDSLPPGAVVTLIQGRDVETGTEFELCDAAPQVVEAKAYATDICISVQNGGQQCTGPVHCVNCKHLRSDEYGDYTPRNAEYEDYQGQETMRRDTEAAFYKRCDEEDAGGRL